MGRVVDVSELYNELRALDKDSFVLCFDIISFDEVNKRFGRSAGDAVIREAFHRVDAAAGDNMTAFRIGGDEFALVTGLSDRDETDKVARRVTELNGKPAEYDGKEIPLSMRVGAVKLNAGGHGIRYSELFNSMQRAINETRDVGKVAYFID